MEIRNWYLNSDRIGRLRVVGQVFGNPKFRDGAEIRTSAVVSITFIDPDHVAITKNSTYLLRDFNG